MQSSLTRFGRFELRGLLGRSSRTMLWRAFDPTTDAEVMLCLPRTQPPTAAAAEAWVRDVRHAARLEHPHLAVAKEVGIQDNWPFMTSPRSAGITLREHLAVKTELTALEVAEWTAQVLQALAFAHDAGLVHGDIQLHNVVIDDKGRAQVMALAAGGSELLAGGASAPGETQLLEVQRAAARQDLLAVGVLMHRLLTAHPVLEEEDISAVMRRIEPPQRAIVKLPWNTPMPVAQGLRAIANRATERLDKQRYQTARTFLHAVESWISSHAKDDGTPVEVLLDRLHTVGLLPALPGVPETVARLVMMDDQRTEELAVEVLGDLALSFEMLRRANSSQVRSALAISNGPVLTIRRCIAMLGLDGIKFAANGLRTWPGPLGQADAVALGALFERVRLAGYAAQELRPPGYDAEIVFLIVAMQSLGRLMLQYHFPEEALEVHRLMQPTPGTPQNGGVETKGMSESAAAMAILGVDLDALGSAVCRHWGMPEELMHMARRLSPERPVRACETDFDLLRTTASAAIELVDAYQLPQAKLQAGIVLIAQRYGRVLSIAPRDLAVAMAGAKRAFKTAHVMEVPKTGAPAEASPAQEGGSPAPSTPSIGATSH